MSEIVDENTPWTEVDESALHITRALERADEQPLWVHREDLNVLIAAATKATSTTPSITINKVFNLEKTVLVLHEENERLKECLTEWSVLGDRYEKAGDEALAEVAKLRGVLDQAKALAAAYCRKGAVLEYAERIEELIERALAQPGEGKEAG